MPGVEGGYQPSEAEINETAKAEEFMEDTSFKNEEGDLINPANSKGETFQQEMTKARLDGLGYGEQVAEAEDPESSMSDSQRRLFRASVESINEGSGRREREAAGEGDPAATEAAETAASAAQPEATTTAAPSETETQTEAQAPVSESATTTEAPDAQPVETVEETVSRVAEEVNNAGTNAEKEAIIVAAIHKYLEENKEKYGYPPLYKKLYEAKFTRPQIVESNITNYLKENREKHTYPVLYNELYKAGYERDEIVDNVIKQYFQENTNVQQQVLVDALLKAKFTQDEINRYTGNPETPQNAEAGETVAPLAPVPPAENAAAQPQAATEEAPGEDAAPVEEAEAPAENQEEAEAAAPDTAEEEGGNETEKTRQEFAVNIWKGIFEDALPRNNRIKQIAEKVDQFTAEEGKSTDNPTEAYKNALNVVALTELGDREKNAIQSAIAAEKANPASKLKPETLTKENVLHDLIESLQG